MRNKNRIARLTALALCLCMVLGMMGLSSAFAQEAPQASVQQEDVLSWENPAPDGTGQQEDSSLEEEPRNESDGEPSPEGETVKTGGISVTNNDIDADAGARRFTVTLDDASVSGIYGAMTFVGGVAELVLAPGESAAASGLSAGMGYTVTAEANGAFLVGSNASGSVPADGTANVVFTAHEPGADALGQPETAVMPIETDPLSTGDLATDTTLEILYQYYGDEDAADHLSVHSDGSVSGEAINGLIEKMKQSDLEVVLDLSYSGADLSSHFFPITVSGGTVEKINGEDIEDQTTVTFSCQPGGTYNTATITLTLTRNTVCTITGLPAGTTCIITDDPYKSGSSTNFLQNYFWNNFVSSEPNDYDGYDSFVKLASGETKTLTGTADFETLEITDVKIEKDAQVDNQYKVTATITNHRHSQYKVGSKVSFKLVCDEGTGLSTVGTNTYYSINIAESEGTQEFEFTVKYDETPGVVPSAKLSLQYPEDWQHNNYGLKGGSGNDTVVELTPQPVPIYFTTNLTVSKTVTGDGDTTKDWDFTVALTGEADGQNASNINGEYGDMTFTSGEATFQLKHGGSKTATGLPVGLDYTVTEREANQDGYTTAKVGDTGTLSLGMGQQAAFTNTKEPPTPTTGNLTVTKTVRGNAGDTTEDWKFTVTFEPATGLEGVIITKTGVDTFESQIGEDGALNFTLKHNETLTVSNIPADTGYTVTETDANQDGYTTTKVADTGTIPAGGTAQAQFTNTKNAVEPPGPGPTPTTGSLTVTKMVTGSAGDADREWHFTVTLSQKLTGQRGEMYFNNGVAEFTLKGGESKTARNLPAGATYTVTEREADQDGYTTSVIDNDGMNDGEGTIVENETDRVEFTNEKNNTPGPGPVDPGPIVDTNDHDHYAYIIGRDVGDGVRIVDPLGEITRAEVATIIFRLLKENVRAEYWSQTNPFPDVTIEEWFNNAISTLYNLGIVEGEGDGLFHPNDPITRAEMAAMMVRLYDYDTSTGDFSTKFDDIDPYAWYARYVVAAEDLGLFIGDGETDHFYPLRNISRAEAMTVYNRLLDRHPHKDHLLPEEEMLMWPDNMDTSAWYYADVQEATNSHTCDIDGYTDEDGEAYESWGERLKERDWAALEKAWSDAYSGTDHHDVT